MILEFFRERFKLLKLNTINSYRIQTAYFSENWFSLGSTFFYSISMYIFIKVIYSNVNEFAGYSENEMLFLLLITQLSYYTDWIWSINNISKLMDSVYAGELDLILSKPIPGLFFLTFRDISLINRLKDGVPNIILVSLLIDWSSLNFDWTKIMYGVVIFICGQISWHCFSFLFALPVFKVGKNKQLYETSVALGNTNSIPYEGFNDLFKFVFTVIIPSLITPQILVSVLLGKSEPLSVTLTCMGVAVLFLVLKDFGWKWALKNYTSATS